MITVNRDHPGITLLTLNRPEKRNSLSIKLMEEIIAAVRETNEMPDQRVLVIRGEGPSFCTGLDLKEAADLSIAEDSANAIANMLLEVYLSSVITIASVKGHAIAGGAGLSSVCDYVIAGENSTFGFPEVHRGLVPAIVLTFLQRQLKERDMRELFLMGDLVTAEHAHRIGLVNQVVPEEMLEEDTMSHAKKALRGGPSSVAHLKRLMEHFFLDDLKKDLEHALALHKVVRTHQEAQEGIKAFMEKRQPNWNLQ
ncbi:MAG: putative enoyl-CoA hydratase echA8 [Chlamydiae bacterium]|nr:putative enoyl-CoA hydratase echA8 [Chlamydiota bacterium]